MKDDLVVHTQAEAQALFDRVKADLTDEDKCLQDPRRVGARRVNRPKPVTLAHGLVLRLAEQIRNDELMSDVEKRQALLALPRNRAEARALLRGTNRAGLAKLRR